MSEEPVREVEYTEAMEAMREIIVAANKLFGVVVLWGPTEHPDEQPEHLGAIHMARNEEELKQSMREYLEDGDDWEEVI